MRPIWGPRIGRTRPLIRGGRTGGGAARPPRGWSPPARYWRCCRLRSAVRRIFQCLAGGPTQGCRRGGTGTGVQVGGWQSRQDGGARRRRRAPGQPHRRARWAASRGGRSRHFFFRTPTGCPVVDTDPNRPTRVGAARAGPRDSAGRWRGQLRLCGRLRRALSRLGGAAGAHGRARSSSRDLARSHSTRRVFP